MWILYDDDVHNNFNIKKNSWSNFKYKIIKILCDFLHIFFLKQHILMCIKHFM